jgi:putative FmdB family regulatory protein
MPIYEYVCKDCKSHFEVIVTSSRAGEIVRCRKCDSVRVVKTISASVFHKGKAGGTIPSGAFSGCSAHSGFK